MILIQKACNKFYSWYWKSKTTAVVAQKSWLSTFVMRYLAFRGWMVTLSKHQDEYLNQLVILFRLQYEIHRLQIHTKSPCRSVFAPTTKLSEQQYALRLVVVPCQYFPSPSPSFQPISPSLSSHISYVAVPHLLRRRIHIFCPASPPPWSSDAVFTADLVFHTHYTGATIRPQVGSFPLSIFAQSVAVLPTHFAISAVPHLICCRPTLPPLPYPSLLSRISDTMLVHRCIHRWPCITSQLSCIYTAPPLLSSHISVAVLITLSSSVPCTLQPLFLYLLWSDILLALRHSVLHCLLRSAPYYFSHSLLWYSHYNFIFSFGTSLLSHCDVIAPLQSATFFLHLPSLRSAPIWSFPSDLSALIWLLHLWYAQLWLLRSYSDLLAQICFDQLAQIYSVFHSSGTSNFS